MDPLIQALLQAGVIDAETAAILSRQLATEQARQWAEDLLFTASAVSLSQQQERLLAFLLETDYDPTSAQFTAFWGGENTALGERWLPTVREIASERATLAAVRAGQAATFDLVNQAVLDWVNVYFTSDDAGAFGSLPNLNVTARHQVADAFLRWQQGTLAGRANGLPQLVRELEPTFGPVRANRIAITETTRIFTQATRIAESTNGFTVGFMWLTSDPCEICAPMHGQERAKASGYDSGLDIPAHVNCKCEEVPLTELTSRRELVPAPVVPESPAPATTELATPVALELSARDARSGLSSVERRAAAEIAEQQRLYSAFDSRFAEIYARQERLFEQSRGATGALAAEIDNEYAENIALLDRLTDERAVHSNNIQAVHARVREEQAQVVQVNRPANNTLNIPASVEQIERERLEAGLDAFNNLVSESVFDGRDIGVTPLSLGERAYYNPSTGSIAMPSSSGSWVAVHELGHALEEESGVLDKVLDFFDRRTAGDQWENLADLTQDNRYGRSERVKLDAWLDPYMGKDYDRTGTEIVSMGIQYMYERPAEFAKEDPDMFDFIFNLLRGQ